ncbi:unnamed protein product, partial [Prorocentrum cordatum]
KPHVHNFDDKRTGIEVQVLKERMTASATGWCWVSSDRQFADGFTKLAARQLLADGLRSGTISLRFDEKFQAAKKKTAKDRQAEAKRFAISKPKTNAMTAPATMTSMTTAAASEVKIYESEALVEFKWTESQRIVISIPLSTFVRGLLSMMMVLVLLGFVCCAVLKAAGTLRPVPASPEPVSEKEFVPTKTPKEKKVKLSTVKWDIGCQGPVNYTSVGRPDGQYGQYKHVTNGFRRGWEVTRELHTEQQKPHHE